MANTKTAAQSASNPIAAYPNTSDRPSPAIRVNVTLRLVILAE